MDEARIKSLIEKIEALKAVEDKTESLEKTIAGIENEVAELKTKAAIEQEMPKSEKERIADLKKGFIHLVRGKSFEGKTVDQMVKDYAEGSDGTGGYFMQGEIATEYIDTAKRFGLARQISRIHPTASKSVDFPYADKTDAYFVDEAGAIDTTSGTVGAIVANVKKIAQIVKMSDEFVEDSPSQAVTFLLEQLAKGFSHREDHMCFAADGTADANDSSFVGLQEDSGIGQVTCSSATSFSNVTVADIANLVAGIEHKYLDNAAFLMHPSMKAVLRKLTDDGGYIWKPSGKDVDTIWGYPVYYTSTMNSTSLSGQSGEPFMVFGDFDMLAFVDRQKYSILRLTELYAANGQVGYRGMERVSQAVLDDDAFARLITA